MNQRPDDHEAAMARADLFKCAQYSFKLFKMIHDGQQLEGWVQAKITKASDYIASVYHYMEYEMKFSEYGEQIENSDMYSESQKAAMRNMITEAKSKVKELTKAQAAKIKKNEAEVKESWEDMVNDAKKRHEQEKGTGKFDKKVTSTGTVYTRKSSTFDDGGDDSDTKKAKKKAKASKTDESAKPDFLDMDKDGNKKEPMKKAVADKKKTPFKKTDEALKGGQTKLDVDKDGKLEKSDFAKLRAKKTTEAAAKCNHTAKGKSCPVHGLKECGTGMGTMEDSHQAKTTMKHVKNPTAGEKKAAKDIKAGTAGYSDRVAMLKSAEKDGRLKEAGKPSAGMSAGAKSALAKKASAGKDIGKPGKSFDKVAKAAGGGEKGTKIAAAAMWKNAAK